MGCDPEGDDVLLNRGGEFLSVQLQFLSFICWRYIDVQSKKTMNLVVAEATVILYFQVRPFYVAL